VKKAPKTWPNTFLIDIYAQLLPQKKVAERVLAVSAIFITVPKFDNHPIVENFPNLVTLQRG
jgi:hypothetical protein